MFSTITINKYRSSFKPRVWLQWLHRWATFTLGIFILLVTISGTLALYKNEINALLYPHLHQITPSASPMTIEAAQDLIHQTFPGQPMDRIVTMPDEAWFVRVGEERNLYVFIDPGTRQINGTLRTEETVMGQITTFHRSLFLLDKDNQSSFTHQLGEWIFRLTAIALMVMVVTGAVLWWPGMKKLGQGFTMRLHKSWYLWHYDWHKVVGFASLPFLFMWAVTGFIFFDDWDIVTNSIYTLTGAVKSERPKVKSIVDGHEPLNSSHAETIALAQVPAGSQVVSVLMPKEAEGVIELWIESPGWNGKNFAESGGDIRLKLDQYSGQVLDNTWTRQSNTEYIITQWFSGLHMGRAVPWWLRTVLFVMGATPLYLAITGIGMWWLKRRSRPRKKVEAKQGMPALPQIEMS